MAGSKKKINDSTPPAGDNPKRKKKSAGEKKMVPLPPSPGEKKSAKKPKKNTPDVPTKSEPLKTFDFGNLSAHRNGQRKVPVAISLREAQDAADKAMEIASLLRASESNLAIVKQRQKKVVEEAAAQIETIRNRFYEEAMKWEQRKAPKTRSGLWAFDTQDKDDHYPLGKKYFACPETNEIYGPDVISKEDLEDIKQKSLVSPASLKKAQTMAIANPEAMPDVIITPDMLGLKAGERPQIGTCAKCDTPIYPQDGHYSYKNLVFCSKDSQCGKCKKMVLLDKDEFRRVVAGTEMRVCPDCAEEMDATGSGTHTPKSNRAKMRDAQAHPPAGDATNDAPAPEDGQDADIPHTADDVPVPPMPEDHPLIAHEFLNRDDELEATFPPGTFQRGMCGAQFCGRQQTDPIHDLSDDRP